jgi:hypothetical protein
MHADSDKRWRKETMKLKILALLALSASLLGLAGCGQQAAPTVTTTPTGVETRRLQVQILPRVLEPTRLRVGLSLS